MNWIQRIIKDAKEPTEPCKADEREKQALADMIKKKGPGILSIISNNEYLEKVERSVLKKIDTNLKIEKDFDVKVEALFNDL